MADLSVTAANCVPGANSNQVLGTAGETIAQGKAVYKSSSTGKWMLADANAATAEARGSDTSNFGVALTGSSLNQPIVVHKSGDLTLGATLTPGLPYYLSDTPGGICLAADIGSGEYVTLIGLAASASVLAVAPKYTGVAN
jgi:hypothetical protein